MNILRTGVKLESWVYRLSIAFSSIKNFFPESLSSQLNILLKKNLSSESSRKNAREIVSALKKARKALLHQLELALAEIEYWHDISTHNKSNKNKGVSRNLLLKGQGIADQISSMESVEAQITNLLYKNNSKN